MMNAIEDLWPIFHLRIETPRLRLQVPRESDLAPLARAARSIGAPGEPHFQMPWMHQPSPEMERSLVQRYWRFLADWRPDKWHLMLAVSVDDRQIGIQSLWASDFSRLRSVGTGSWITQGEQRNGYGTEARAAVLELAFGQLAACEARTEYVQGNHASERISRKLGYADNGHQRAYREGAGSVPEYRMRLDHQSWQRHASAGRCVITGMASCLTMFGAGPADRGKTAASRP
jgi:RimJ/RimL family protein N-acetyltransferase